MKRIIKLMMVIGLVSAVHLVHGSEEFDREGERISGYTKLALNEADTLERASDEMWSEAARFCRDMIPFKLTRTRYVDAFWLCPYCDDTTRLRTGIWASAFFECRN